MVLALFACTSYVYFLFIGNPILQITFVNFIDFFSSPYAYMDPLCTNMTYMFVSLFKDALNEYAYAAELAGLNYDLQSTIYGLTVS